jgi:hypothetical protein
MAKNSVYVETTIASYLVARPSENPLAAARQAITKAWWETRSHYNLMISPEVLREIAQGDAHAAKLREKTLIGIPVLDFQNAVAQISDALLASGVFPTRARSDAIHLAFASAYAADVLVTWNLRHIANPLAMKRSREIVTMMGYVMPEICTPEQLLATGE